MHARAGSLLLLLLAFSGCVRKLPGPAECRAFALAAHGIEPGTPASRVARLRAGASAEEMTRQCLTTPWDYKLLSCLQTTGNSPLCLARFEQRRLGAGDIE
jgi:hypothetical protein